jgi:RNA recognition motif-containing protein
MNIFITKLNFASKESTVRAAFEAFGAVNTVNIVTDKATGRSKGYGFVEMPNDNEALEAIEGLNDSEIDGRQVVVKKSMPKPKSDGNDGYGNRRNNYR